LNIQLTAPWDSKANRSLAASDPYSTSLGETEPKRGWGKSLAGRKLPHSAAENLK